jgi:hypothetical protein
MDTAKGSKLQIPKTKAQAKYQVVFLNWQLANVEERNSGLAVPKAAEHRRTPKHFVRNANNACSVSSGSWRTLGVRRVPASLCFGFCLGIGIWDFARARLGLRARG